jgi:hypothetical protein
MEKPPQAEPWEKHGVALLALFIAGIFLLMALASVERLITHSRDDGRSVGQAHAEQAADPRLTDWVQAGSAFFSFVLTISILGVYRRQAALMKTQADLMSGQLEVATIAANAAEKAAEAAQLQGRLATLSMHASMDPGFPNPIKRGAESWDVDVTVKNVGRAKGEIGNTYVRFCDDLPSTPDYDIVRMNVRQDQTTRLPGEWKPIGTFHTDSKKNGQFLYGFMNFKDEMGRWRRRFCVQVFDEPLPGNISYLEIDDARFNGEDFTGT